MGYFDTDHLIAPPITFGPRPGFWQSLGQGISQQYHVDSAYGLDDEVQNRYLKSLRTYEDLTGHKTSFPVDAEFLDDYIRTTQGSGPSYWHRNVFTGELGQRYKQYIDEFQKADEGIKALGRPDIPSMEQVLADVSQMQHKTEEETQRQSETGGVGATIGRFIGGAVGSFTPRDPLNLATLPIGGFGKSVVTRIATEGVLQAGIVGATDVAFVNPNRQLVGLPAHNTMYDMMLAAVGGAALRGLGEVGAAGVRRFRGDTPLPEIRGEAPTNDELHAVLDALPDNPRVRAGKSILDAVEDIERVNPYGDGPQGHARFMEEMRRVQNAMNGEPETAIARFLPPLPEVPAERIESNFDFQLVREQQPELYDRMQATQAAVKDIEGQIGEVEQRITQLSPTDAAVEESPSVHPSEPSARGAEFDEKLASIEQKIKAVVQKIDEKIIAPSTARLKEDLVRLRRDRKTAVRRYKDAYGAVQAEADQIKLRRDIAARMQNSKEVGAIVAGGQGRPFPPISVRAAEDIAEVARAADEAMPERVDTLVTKQPNDGTVDIGLDTPVPGDRFFLDESGQKVTFAKTMADLADDDRTAEAMRTCLL